MDKTQVEAFKKFLLGVQELAKSVPEVKDLWEDIHGLPTEIQTVTGHAEAADGGNADAQIKRYSELAPQVAIARLYGAVDRMFSDFTAAKSEWSGRFTSIETILKSLSNAHVTKGRTSAEATADLEKCLVTLGGLKAKANVAAVTKAETRIKYLKSEIEFLKAIEVGSATAEQIKAFETLKAEEDELGFDEEGEDDEKGKEKSKAQGYLKAVEDIEGFVAALTKGETVTVNANSPTAVRAKAVAEKIVTKSNDQHDAGGKFSETNGGENKDEKDEAEKLKGQIAVLTSRLDEVIKGHGAVSKGTGTTPSQKGGSTSGESIVRTAVMKALEDGTVPAESQTNAMSLLQQFEAVAEGRLGKDVFDRNLQLAPASVKPLFTIH